MEFHLSKRDAEQFAFEHKEGDEVLAEISWTQLGDVLVVDHTFVSESLRGQGVAKKLLDAVVQFARENNYKIEAVCSYVVTAFNKSNEYDDVKA